MNNAHEIHGANTALLPLLFYEASSEHGSPSGDRRLNQMYERIPEVNDLLDVVGEKLIAVGVEKGTEAVCDELDALGEAREKQGFINGFRLGMMLREELTG